MTPTAKFRLDRPKNLMGDLQFQIDEPEQHGPEDFGVREVAHSLPDVAGCVRRPGRW